MTDFPRLSPEAKRVRFGAMQFSRLALVGLLAFSTLGTRADLILRAPATPPPAGAEFVVELVETNPSAEPAAPTTSEALPLLAGPAGGAPVSAVFTAADPRNTAPIPAGGFRTTRFRGALPTELVGLVVLDAAATGAGRVAVDLVPADPIPPLAERQPSPLDPTTAPLPGPRDLGLSPHEPIYFSVGGEGGLNARFQFSFKFRAIGPSDDRIAGRGFWEDLYAAYTQTSLWDLHSLSKPFTDSSYRPALFYHRHDLGTDLFGGRLGLAAGLEHESNGKSGDDSRSINIAFARPTLRWGAADDWQFTFSPRLYAYLEKSENADIARYRGHGDFLVVLEHPRSLKLAATLRFGTSGRGSVLVDASYPFSKVNDLLPLGLVHGYLHLQFFDGWGESLLHYDERAETQLRIGFMAVR